MLGSAVAKDIRFKKKKKENIEMAHICCVYIIQYVINKNDVDAQFSVTRDRKTKYNS